MVRVRHLALGIAISVLALAACYCEGDRFRRFGPERCVCGDWRICALPQRRSRTDLAFGGI